MNAAPLAVLLAVAALLVSGGAAMWSPALGLVSAGACLAVWSWLFFADVEG